MNEREGGGTIKIGKVHTERVILLGFSSKMFGKMRERLYIIIYIGSTTLKIDQQVHGLGIRDSIKSSFSSNQSSYRSLFCLFQWER